MESWVEGIVSEELKTGLDKKATQGHNSSTWKILPNGDLEISFGDFDLAEIKERVSEGDTSDNLMYEMFEHVIANGLMWVAPEDIGALTSAPILSDGDVNDNGSLDFGGSNIWWYPNYAVTSPMQEIAETGKVVFKNANVEGTRASQKENLVKGSLITKEQFDNAVYTFPQLLFLSPRTVKATLQSMYPQMTDTDFNHVKEAHWNGYFNGNNKIAADMLETKFIGKEELNKVVEELKAVGGGDRYDFAGYCRQCTDTQLMNVLEKEREAMKGNPSRRTDYQKAKEEACRRGLASQKETFIKHLALEHGIDAPELQEEIIRRATKESDAKKRLEELRKELRAESISYGELAELQSLIPYIEPGDNELLEAAGVPEKHAIQRSDDQTHADPEMRYQDTHLNQSGPHSADPGMQEMASEDDDASSSASRQIKKLEQKARRAKEIFQQTLDQIYELDEVEGDRVRESLENFPHG